MATLAQLATIFTVDNSQFKAGLRENESLARRSSDTVAAQAKKMATGFRGTINSVFSLRSAVATLAGGAGIGLLIKNEMQAIDQTAKFARMIGVSTEELTGLQHAAQLTSGMVDGQFNMAMQRMARRIAEAAQGTGEAKAAIKELGLDAKALADAGPGEAFKQISDAIQGVEDPTQRLRIGFKLFDSEGAKLVNTLSLGREGIEELQAEAQKLGATYSDFDASQVEMANDAVERMRKSFKATTTQLAIRLAPVIGAVADQITEMQIQSKGTFDTIDSGGKTALFVIKAFADGVHTIKIAFMAVRVIAVSLLSVVMNIASAFLHFIADIIDLPNKLNPLIEKFNKIPGVKIPLFGAVDRTGFMADIDEMARMSVGAITMAKEELHQMMMEPLPSKSIDDFIKGVQEKTAAAREVAMGNDVANIERLTETHAVTEEIEQQHQDRLAEIQSQGQSQLFNNYTSFLDSMELASKQSGAVQLNTITGALASMTAAGATESKKMFKLNKAAGIANAIVSTYQGMTKALEWGWPMGPVFAGLIGAAGFANVQSIRSASFSGGGGGVAPSIGPTPAPPVTPVGNSGQIDQQPQRVVNVTISGPVDRQFLKDALLPALQEEIDENDVTFINANSAQARELRRET